MSEERPKFCGYCGAKLFPGAAFCASCGKKVPQAGQEMEVITSPPMVSPAGSHFPYRPGEQMTAMIPQQIPSKPFTLIFKTVLIKPKEGMGYAANNFSWKNSLLIVLLGTLLIGISLLVAFTRANVTFSDEFFAEFSSFGVEFGPEERSVFESAIGFNLVFASLIDGFVNWLIMSLITWVIFAIVSSNVPSYQRPFKKIASVVAWSSISSIFHGIVTLINASIFVEPISSPIDSMEQLSIILAGNSPFVWVVMASFVIINVWSAILIYYGAKTIDSDDRHAIIIAILFFVAGVVMYFMGF